MRYITLEEQKFIEKVDKKVNTLQEYFSELITPPYEGFDKVEHIHKLNVSKYVTTESFNKLQDEERSELFEKHNVLVELNDRGTLYNICIKKKFTIYVNTSANYMSIRLYDPLTVYGDDILYSVTNGFNMREFINIIKEKLGA